MNDPRVPERYPRNVYTWQNDMVMVFDQFGDQMPELQGPRDEVWPKIQAAKRADTEFAYGSWRAYMPAHEQREQREQRPAHSRDDGRDARSP